MKQIKTILAALILISPFAANADPILDQSSGVGSYNVSYCAVSGPGGCEWQQQVTAGISGLLTSIDLAVNGTGSFALSLWNSGSTFNTATEDALKTFAISGAPGNGMVNLDVSDLGIMVTAGQSFLFEFEAISGSMGLQGHTGDAYAAGTLGLRWANQNYTRNNYGPGYDLGFQTYVDSDTITVPEPSSLALLGLGLAGLGLSRRRKQSSV